MGKVILLRFNFLIPSLRYIIIYIFTCAIKTHITSYLTFKIISVLFPSQYLLNVTMILQR